MAEITADSTIYDLLKAKPDATEALFKFGMGCVGCAIARGRQYGRQQRHTASRFPSFSRLSV